MKAVYEIKSDSFILLSVQYKNNNKCDIEDLVGKTLEEYQNDMGSFIVIPTNRGTLHAYETDYVCRDIYGNIYVFESVIFENIFEKA